MARQFIRVVQLYIGGSSTQNASLLVENLRIDFSIEKSISSEPNKATFKVYNLSPQRRYQISQEFTRVALVAGYDEEEAELYVGNIRNVRHVKDQNGDVMTIIDCGDGDKAIRTSTTTRSLPPNSGTQDILRGLIDDMKETAKGYFDDLLGKEKEAQTPRGLVLNGSTAKELDFFSSELDYNWSIQNNSIDVVTKTGFIDDVVYISPDSGMIGTPEATEIGANVTCLINPRIQPNRLVVIYSPFYEETKGDTDAGGGVYRVKRLTITGSNDARMNDFYCNVVGQRVQNGKVV